MFEKIVQNFIGVNPSRQITHVNSLGNRNRDSSRDQMPDLLIRKVKSADSDPPRLLVSIWETESTFEMFDYENKTIKAHQYRLDGNNDLYLANMDKRSPKCIITRASTPNGNTYCGTIERARGNHYFIPGTHVESYRVIGAQSNQQCFLRAGDLIRIGRMKYFVKETYDGMESRMKQFQRDQNAKQLNIRSLKSGSCKFCLCDQKDNPDLLISPCSCKGSCAQVHLQCLKQWLSNKVTRKSTPCVQFLNYDNFSCELCKQDLPITIKVDGKVYSMLAQPTTATTTKDPYIVLQGIPSKKTSATNNMSIKIKFTQKQSIVLGRGHEADVRLEDVSISRQHCIIKFVGGKFELMDNKSKFGTLMKLEPNHKVNLDCNKVQIARMTIEMSKPETTTPNYQLKY